MNAIDLFSGAGGFTEGAKQADINVLWAANHWQTAINVHRTNHPDTIHSCQDLQQANFYNVPDCDIILASPACQGHSKARGNVNTVKHDAYRSTAWAVISAAEAKQSEYLIIENVPEFLKWKLYPNWKSCLQSLGYSVSENIINSATIGVPQNRRRLFLLCTKSKNPLYIKLQPKDKHPIRSIIDWNEHGKHYSQFFKSEKWKERFFNTKLKHGDTAILSYYGNETHGRSIDEPIGTITTNAKFAIVHGDHIRFLTTTETKKAMGFPDNYQLTGIKTTDQTLLGNAVCPPVAKSILQYIQKEG